MEARHAAQRARARNGVSVGILSSVCSAGAFITFFSKYKSKHGGRGGKGGGNSLNVRITLLWRDSQEHPATSITVTEGAPAKAG